DLERRAVGDRATARDPHGFVRPQALLGALPAEYVRLQTHAVARGEHDVLPDFQILRGLEQVAFLTHDCPRALALEDVDRDRAERRAALGVEDQGLLGLEPPANPGGDLFDLGLLDAEVGAGRDGAGRLGRRAPALGN